MEQMIVSLVFVVLGAMYLFFPKQYFELRAWLYKVIYKAKMEGSARLYFIYRIIGIVFIMIGLWMALMGVRQMRSQSITINSNDMFYFVADFESCVDATGIVMESYPRKCRYDGKTYTEGIDYGETKVGEVACTMDAKECPDGSFVGRVAPDCEFAVCPGK